MHNISKMIAVWIKLSYGEIIRIIPEKNNFLRFLILALIHAILILAILQPGTTWGIYACAISALCFLWNVCLDPYSGSWFSYVRTKIIAGEKKSQNIATQTGLQKIQKFFWEYLRIHILFFFMVAGLILVGLLKV